MKKNRHIALLLAAGRSSRMSSSRPKQYMQVGGESVLLHTMRAFQRHPLICDIYVVCTKEWEVAVLEEANAGGISKFRGAITGGETAFLSLKNGIRALADEVKEHEGCIVLVHDAVRPLISQDIISRNIAVCLTHGNAITAIASHEAFIVTKDGTTSTGFLPREGLMRAQTPHTFPLHTLCDIMQKAETMGIQDAQSLFTLANEVGISPLHIAEGDIMNIKLTHPNDILLYQALRNLE